MEGLLVGLAEGLKQGVTSYNEARERKMREQAQNAGFLEHGLIQDENGNLGYTDAKKLEMQTQSKSLQDQQEELSRKHDARDPNSIISRNNREFLRGHLKNSGIDEDRANQMVPDTMSAEDVEKNSGLIKADASTTMGLLRADITRQRLATIQAGLGIKQGNQATGVANTFDNDEIIRSATKQKNNMDRAQHTLSTAQTLTPEIFNEIQGDIAGAIAQGSSSAMGEQQKKEFDSYSLQLSKLKERITNKPQDIGSPEVKQYMQDLINRLNESYSGNISARAKQLSEGRDYSNNPMAQKALESKKAQYDKYDHSKEVPGILNPTQEQIDRYGGGKGLISSGPKVGSIEDGHKFLGGDPSNPKSWELVK